jgi:hypothetical protein
VVAKRNMINDYLWGRACVQFARGVCFRGSFLILGFSCSFCFGFELFFALFLCSALFVSIVGLAAFPLLDDFLELFLAFDLLAVLIGALDSKFKFCAFCCECTHQGGE